MAEKPNIVLIMCDQLRPDYLGCYGGTVMDTPNIDRIARRGVAFNRAYSQTPVCIPARYSMIFGKNTFELGLLENGRYRGDGRRPLAEQIRNAGFYTCAVGKLHHTPSREHHGFDHILVAEGVPRHFDDDDYVRSLIEAGYGNVHEPNGMRSEHYYEPQTLPLPEQVCTSAWVARNAVEVIRKNRNRPFFLFASFFQPHPPFAPCVPYDRMYSPGEMPAPVRAEHEKEPLDPVIDTQNSYKVGGIENCGDEKTRQIRAHYCGSIAQTDVQIGRILDALERYGLDDNTLVLFVSDHGDMLGDHYAFGKRTYYESSARVPFIVSWPARLPQNETRGQFAILPDVYATLLAAAGGPLPEDIAGTDLLPACLDAGAATRECVVGAYEHDERLKYMLRRGSHKYIYMENGGLEQLFDLDSDPDELYSIADENAPLCAGFRQELAAFFRRQGFTRALNGDTLACLPRRPAPLPGYLDQRSHWAETALDYSV